ncbi:MAG: hypothetical protein V1776_01555 [Candidatus Diapherotrites archaeon]
MPFIIFRTPLFKEQFDRLSEYEKERVRRFILQIHMRGDSTGKPLRYRFFLEKKFDGRRMYFLVYQEWSAVLMVAIGNKKTQDKDILATLEQLPVYREFIRKELEIQDLLERRLPLRKTTFCHLFETLFDIGPIWIAGDTFIFGNGFNSLNQCAHWNAYCICLSGFRIHGRQQGIISLKRLC